MRDLRKSKNSRKFSFIPSYDMFLPMVRLSFGVFLMFAKQKCTTSDNYKFEGTTYRSQKCNGTISKSQFYDDTKENFPIFIIMCWITDLKNIYTILVYIQRLN